MLPEDKRTQLDTIVQDMVRNKESDSNIKFVVEDFKKKYSVSTVSTKPKKDILQKTGDVVNSIFPGKQVGESIGTLAGAGIAEARGRGEFYETTGVPTPTQVVGDVLSGVATVAGAKLPLKGSIVKTATKVGGLSALGATGEAMADKKDVSDILKSAITAGVIGGALTGTVGVVGKGVNTLTKKAPANIYNSAIKANKAETKAAIKYGGKTLGDELVERGITGSDKSLLSKSITKLQENEDKLQNILGMSKQTISRTELSSYLDDLVKTKQATPGLGDDVEKVKGILQEFPNEVPIAQANQIKRNLYNALTDVAFKIDPSLSTKKEAMKALAKGIKNEIERKTEIEVGKDVVKNINKELSVFGRLQDRVLDKLATKSKNNLLGLTDYITLGGGIGYGASEGTPEAFATGLGAVALKKGLTSTLTKTNVAVKLNKIGNIIERIPTDKAGNISKAALITALSKMGRKD